MTSDLKFFFLIYHSLLCILGFIVRESKEVIYRAREAAGKMCYSGDMFDNWTYFGPVEMIEKDQYNKVCQCITGVVI